MKRQILASLTAALLLITTPPPPRRAASQDLTALEGLRHRVMEMYGQQKWTDVIELCSQGYQIAAREHRPAESAWFLEPMAGANFESGAYREALDDYLKERDIALKAGLRLQTAVALANLSSLYLHVYDTAAALAAVEDAYRLLPEDADPGVRSQILAQFGRVLLIRRDGGRARELFREAIEVAFRAGDTQNESLAWDQMGLELLRAGDLDHAETALSKAFYQRALDRDPNLYETEYFLAELKLKRGDTNSARHLIAAAFANRHGDRVQVPQHLMFATRARIRQAQGDLEGSFADYLRAVDAAEEWRSRGLFADTFRISTDALLEKQALGQDAGIYGGAVDAAVRLFERTGDQRYAVLSLELNERIRTASLREIVIRGRAWTRHVPPEYWSALEELRAIESDEFGGGATSPTTRERVGRLRLSLAEMEARAGAEEASDNAPPANVGAWFESSPYHLPANSVENLVSGVSLTRIRTVLGNSRTLISFHSGEQASYRWVITDKRFELKVLPGRRELDNRIGRMRKALETDNTEAEPLSEKVCSDLFGGISPDESRKRWLVALDEGLFDLPLAALICGRHQGRPEYLAESRAVELVPGGWAITSESKRSQNRSFVGAGDGIYNTADPRYRLMATPGWRWPGLVSGMRPSQTGTRQWPRLVASGPEVEACAREAGGEVTILTGAALNRRSFVDALAREPAFVHIAAHFLWHEGEAKTAIALGLRPGPDGRPKLELLTADDVANLRVPGAVVVMSGCSSSKGEVVPAAGLLGLSRAWLVAGADAVVATLWPTPDDTGELVTRFYDHLRENARGDRIAPGEALRRAQVDMLHSGTWRSNPRYWAAYQVMGRSN